jgi:autophagy-related protein 101
MNSHQIHLPELELRHNNVRECLQCLLHTLLFLRAPGPVAPVDVDLESFSHTYVKIGAVPDVDRQVDAALDDLLSRGLSAIGPELSAGTLSVSFFERRVSKALFGLLSSEERFVWEVWHLHVVVNSTPRPTSDDVAAVIERARIQASSDAVLQDALMYMFDKAGKEVEHIPPVMYEFAIKVLPRRGEGGGGGGGGDEREDVYSRVARMPSLVNLSA